MFSLKNIFSTIEKDNLNWNAKAILKVKRVVEKYLKCSLDSAGISFLERPWFKPTPTFLFLYEISDQVVNIRSVLSKKKEVWKKEG